MKPDECVLEIHDQHGQIAQTKLTLIECAYCTKIKSIMEAYPVMLPGDTVTVIYLLNNGKVEVDYTYPEHRLNTPGARRENELFDRIITYKSHNEYSDDFLQDLYEYHVAHTLDDVNEYIPGVPVVEIFFYSNYLSRQINVGERNVIRVNRDNPGFVP